jgi:hypothetical protein
MAWAQLYAMSLKSQVQSYRILGMQQLLLLQKSTFTLV